MFLQEEAVKKAARKHYLKIKRLQVAHGGFDKTKTSKTVKAA